MATEPTTITLPFTIRDSKTKTVHFGERRADGAKHLGALLVLDNRVWQQLGENVGDLVITIEAGHAPRFKLEPDPDKAAADERAARAASIEAKTAAKPTPKAKATPKPKPAAK